MFPFYANYMQNLQKKTFQRMRAIMQLHKAKSKGKPTAKKCDIIQK